jgi:serine protease Do
MAYPVSLNGVRLHKVLFALLSLFGCITISVSVFPIRAFAQTRPPGYAQAENAFAQLNVDQRIKLQILLTAAGYWQAVPNVEFSTRLFNAICQYEVDNGFVPLGIVNDQRMDRLASIGGSFLNKWGFELIRHPYPLANSQIWVPLGLPVTQQVTSTGLKFMNPSYGLALTYDFFPEFNVRISFESLLHKLERNGAKIYYSNLYRDEFFVLSYSDGITDAYVRYHQTGRNGVGFTLYWNHDATDAHFERIATLISGSLWSSATGAPFAYPFVVKAPSAEATRPLSPPTPPPPSLAPTTGPQQEEPHTAKSGTGFFLTSDGAIADFW